MQIHLIPHDPPYGILWPDNLTSILGFVILAGIIALMLRAELRRGSQPREDQLAFCCDPGSPGDRFQCLPGRFL